MSPLTYLCLSIMLIHGTKTAEIQTAVGNADGFRPHVHKYLVMLHIHQFESHTEDHQIFSCSGSIIDKKWIISAAHCFPGNISKIEIITLTGSKKNVLGFGKGYSNHPHFIQNLQGSNCTNTGNDLALVKTSKPIQLNAFIKPIALARFEASGQQGIVAGYGWGIPQEGAVVVKRCKAPRDCKMLCSQYRAYAEQGDSGGALTTDDGLIGVISTASKPMTFFVDISLHFDWIQKITGKKLHI